MTQTWNIPFSFEGSLSQGGQAIIDALEALVTLHAGPTQPVRRYPHMLWADTTANVLKQRDATNTSWVVLLALGAPNSVGATSVGLGDITATASRLVFVAPADCTIIGIDLVAETSTTSSDAGTTEWTFELTKVNGTPAELFGSTVGTDSEVEGIGGGEVVANTAYPLAPDQNATLAAGDVLEFTATKTGSPADLDGVLLVVRYQLTGG